MGYLAFFALAFQRTRKRWGLTFFSLLGIALTIGLISSIPMFTDAVGFKILRKELEKNAYGNTNPPLALRYYRQPNAEEVMTVQQALDMGNWLGAMTTREMGLPVARRYYQIGSHALMVRALEGDARYKERDLRQVRINCVPGIDDHITIVEGQPFTQADGANELLLWGSSRFLDKLGVQVGDQFELFNYNAVRPDVPTRFRVAGAFAARDPASPFWYRDPDELLGEEMLTSVGAFSRFVAPIMPTQVDFAFWYFVLDDTRMRFADVDRYSRGAESARYKAESLMDSMRVDRTPIDPLKRVQVRTTILNQLLFGFSLPIVALMLFFVVSISAIAVQTQAGEVAMLISRGAGRTQILLISLLEGVIHLALATPLGLLMSVGIAQAMSLNSGFMTFDIASPLPPAVQALDWRLVWLALGVSLVARLIPAMRATMRTVVTHGRERARSTAGNTVLKLLLDVVLVAATYYAHHQLTTRGTFGAVSWQPDGGAKNDPLLFLAPTLFILTSAWLSSQFFPLLMRIPELLGRLIPSTSLYLGLRNLARESGPYVAPLFVVATCLCLGAFEASVARSANTWLDDRWHYKAGADFSFTLGTRMENGMEMGKDAWLLPIEDYRKVQGVTDAMRVGNYEVLPRMPRSPKMRLMAIDRLDFARVAYLRDDYTRVPMGELLNKLGATPSGILVTPKFLTDNTLNIGERLTLEVFIDTDIQPVPFTIVGTFDYLPTVYEKQKPTIVGNLEYIHDQFGGISPFGLWLRLEPGTDRLKLRQTFESMQVVMMNEVDGMTLVEEDRQAMERVGIFGNLTVGFLAGSLLAWLGLLIYTFSSLIGRVRRFTILRALGLRLGQVLATVTIEYLGVILYGIAFGTAAGIATAKLFVPYFQFTEDPSAQVPPFTPQIAWEQIAMIVGVYFLVLALAEFIVLLRLTRREAFQALRMGDEE